jgi:RNA polymerase sigma-70 factor (ECF subfamily)
LDSAEKDAVSADRTAAAAGRKSALSAEDILCAFRRRRLNLFRAGYDMRANNRMAREMLYSYIIPAGTLRLMPQAGRSGKDAGMLSEAPDLDLIAGIARREEGALRELHRRFGGRMLAHAQGILGDRYLAEDAVQESLIAVWEGAPSFRGDGRAIAWLLGIVHHKAVDLLRRQRTSFRLGGDWDLLSGNDGPEEDASTAEYRRIVRRSLGELSPAHRATLDLVFYQGLRLEEAARVLGCPVGTVKSRLHQAKEHLRKTMARAGWNAEDLR